GAAADRTKPVDPLRNPGTPGLPIPVPTGPYSPPTPTPGDTTVSTLHQSVAAAVLGGVLLAPSAPARAVPPLPAVPIPGAVAADDKTDLATVKTQVEEANKKLAAIQEQLKLITEALNGKKDGHGIRLESDPGLIEEMKRLKDKLAQV